MLLLFGVCLIPSVFSNLLVNPRFDDDLDMWRVSGTCNVDKSNFQSNPNSVHCTDDSVSSRTGLRQTVSGMETGVNYKVSVSLKMKNVKSSRVLLFLESLDSKDSYGIYSDTIPECVNGSCYDKFYTLSGITTTPFTQSTNVFGVLIHPNEGLGEIWIDDVLLEPTGRDIVLGFQVMSWRQEVFTDVFEVRVGLDVQNSVYQNGNFLNLQIAVVQDLTYTLKNTLTKFEMKNDAYNTYASFQVDPKDLEIGYYTLKLTCENTKYPNKEVKTTMFRKTPTQIHHNIHVDNNLITWMDNKKFFPLGLYFDQITDTDTSLFKDSPFNLIVSPGGMTADQISEFNKQTDGRGFVIRPFTKGVCCGCGQSDLDAAYLWLKDKINEFKDIKGFFGYYPIDEPKLDCYEEFLNATRTIRENDPDHVIYTAINLSKEISTLHNLVDVFGLDVYPVTNGGYIEDVFTVSNRGRRGVVNGKSMWNIPQIFDWTRYNGGTYPVPTEQQMRQMTYQFIVGGAMGIIYYDFTDLHKMDYKTPFETQWNSVKRIAKELKEEYSDIIYSEEKPSGVFGFENDGNNVGMRVWRYKHVEYALIVNNKNIKNSYSFNYSGVGHIEKMTGQGLIKQDGYTVDVELPELDVIWIRVADSVTGVAVFIALISLASLV
ncbi:hypothetical protein EIN_424360 [Entamoeba invadens IP1]|uniref:Uncharacterized protein n=1 Tax=Entamoeba invadens IP1 TaxID=370355 RepID=A0A0A1UBS6_ENTIV|nr:hypothetical protein EIN_424360 [Entamoeba invadens IP1]ELP89754.1 hypothetical protein EIN_424360 [Entamoeba invadens IP1]|eukprot:XP_004256525.1 hypothetical protein EIN_424360 [Entamoeba invadens IP1]